MRITEALEIIQKTPHEGSVFEVNLACGFTPFHLRTFLSAHLQRRLPQRPVHVSDGLYGDLPGTLVRSAGRPVHAVAVALEWADLDPRLGYRSTGTWGPDAIADILNVVEAVLARVAEAIGKIPSHVRIAVSLPTVPLPPLFHTAGWQASQAELVLEQQLATFAAGLVQRSGLAVLNRLRLAEESPPAARYDLKSDLLTGLPYTLSHAGILASALTR